MKIVDPKGNVTEVRGCKGIYLTSNPRFGDLLLVNPATKAPIREKELATGMTVAVVSGSGVSPLTYKVI